MLELFKDDANVAYTENGARAYKSTKSSLVDFFALAGAVRDRSESDVISMFTKAYAEDPLLAMKMIFYFRDIREGQGERKTFKTIIKYLANVHTESMSKNVELIQEFGRWDDMYALFGTKLEQQALSVMKTQFVKDLGTETPSLLAKWLKSENASSSETVKLARKTRIYFGLTPRQYRKALSKLRNKIRVVEALMSSNQWNKIEYDKLPSKAGMQYRQAFKRHDEEGYNDFLESLKKGEKKINAKTLYPYEIVGKVIGDSSYFGGFNYDETLEQMWKALPDYIGKAENSLAVVDTSGSMYPHAITVALSLGVYLAERNTGIYKDHFFTFSSRPQFVELKGSNLCEKLENMSESEWGMDTNIEAVFNKVLDLAVRNKISQSEMVSKLYIISDMEFNHCVVGSASKTLFDTIRKRFEDAGYVMPQLVFWNVNARNNQFPMKFNEQGVMLVSGSSPTIFTNLMKDNIATPFDLMMDVIGGERYSEIVV